MPPRKKAPVRALAVNTDSSDDGETRQQAPTKRAARGKVATNTVEKRAAPAARARKKATVVEEFTEDDVDPIEDDEMEDTVVLEPEPGRKPKASKKITKPEPAKGRGGRKLPNVEGKEPEDEQTESEVPDPEGPKAAKRGGKKVAGKEDIPKKRMTKKERDAKEKAEREIAETQFEEMDVDPPSEHSATEDEIAPTPTQVHRAGIRGATVEKTGPATTTKGRKVVRMEKSAAEEVQTEEEQEQEEDDLAKPTRALATVAPLGRGRSNKNPTNGEGEVFKDLEKAYQALRIRYNNLQEAKETEAEQALKTFQKNMKEKDEERSRVIEALQSDLKAQQKAQEDFSAETKVLKKKLAVKETEISKLQTKVQELSKSLQDQQNESKVMSAKLVQAQAQAQVQAQRNNAQVPGSAVKLGYRGPLGNPKANTGAVDDAWLARVKEELYADLCGLIIVNVRKENDSNVFECVQTGVNGLAVHFKLSVPNQHVKAKRTQESKDPTDVELDEDEVIFIPLFDEARDKTVIDLLPSYLRDEISFQRDHMTKFYQKINSLFMMTITADQPEGESGDDDDDDDDDDGDTEDDEEGE